jgi:hypothetical protein
LTDFHGGDMSEGPAQTNLQLYNQLVALSWSDDDLRRLRAAYELADRVFAGTNRHSGKPFIAHLVGTASIAADVDGRRDLVLAALLHSIYTGGGTAILRKAPSREAIRGLVESSCEEIIYAYATTPWSPAALSRALVDGVEFDSLQRCVLLLRLVNEVDERVDLGTRYDDKGAPLRGDDPVPQMVVLAERLDCPKLAAALQDLLDQQRGVEVPVVLRASTHVPSIRVSRSFSAGNTLSARPLARGKQVILSLPGARVAADALRRRRPSAL